MANSYTYQVLSDTNKRSVIKLTGQLDANGEIANTKIQGKNLRGALSTDANNAVLVNNPSNSAFNGIARTSYNYAVARIFYDINIPNGYITLNWDGTIPTPIAVLSGKFDLNIHDNLGVILNTANTPNGNITLTTTGAATNTSYTIILELHKTPGGNCDYDMGAINSPSDFNFGKYAVKP